jgi:hypothetical protein
MTDDFLTAIGEVTVQFATLEHQLQFAIWSLLVGTALENQATGQIVTAEISFRRAVHLFGALFRHRFPGRDDSELESVCAEIFRAENERNVIAHSTWALADEGKVLRIKTTAKGELKTKFEKLGVSDIRAIASRIHSAAERLLNFHLDVVEPGHARVTL